MADNFTYPGFDYAAQQGRIDRRKALLQAIMQQGSEPLQTNRMSGGWAVPISPFEGIAKLAQTAVGVYGGKGIEKEQTDLAARAQGDYKTALAAALKNSDLQQSEIDSITAAGSNPMTASMMPFITSIAQQKRQMAMIPQLIQQLRGGPQGAPQGPQEGEGTVLAPGMSGAPQGGQQGSGLPVGGDYALSGAMLGNPGVSKIGEMLHADSGTRGGVQYDQAGKAFVVTNNGQVKYLPGITARDKNEMVDTGPAVIPTNPYNGTQGQPIQKGLNPGQTFQIPLDIRSNAMQGQRQQFETGIAPPPMPQLGPAPQGSVAPPLPQGQRPLPGAVNNMPVSSQNPVVRGIPNMPEPQGRPLMPQPASPYAQVGMTPKQQADLAAKRADEQPKAEFGLNSARAKAQNVISKVDEALTKVGFKTTGAVGTILGHVPGTSAYDLDKTIDTVRANLGFKELQDMRAASPTGGALGSVSENELKYLESAVSSLDKGQSAEQLSKRLMEIKSHYQNWLNTVERSYTEQYGKPPALNIQSVNDNGLTHEEQKEYDVLKAKYGK